MKDLVNTLKKRLALAVVCLLALALVACSKQEQPEKADEPEITEAVTPEITDAPDEKAETSDGTPELEPEEEVLDLHIKDLFAEHGIKAGTCLTTMMINDKTQEDIILNQFNSITMENSMKPDYLFNKEKSIAEGDLVVEFNSDMITMLDWAKANGMAVRGHTLIWHSQTPNWIFYEDFDTSKALVSREVMLARMESYFKQVFTKLEEAGYIDLFYAYDIANECWMEDGSMRQSNWLATIGEDYLIQAFTLANKYAPESIDLYYNDYNEQFKTKTLVDFVNTLVDADGNYLIDGVGFQAHLYTEDSLPIYFSTVDALAATGLKVQLTELDVCLGHYQKPLLPIEDNTKAQGRFYYNLIEGLFSRIDKGTLNMDALTFWGFSDAASWRKEYYPMLYNKKYAPKYAYYGAMQIKEKAGFDN